MFEFNYRLTGRGWAEARIADERDHAIVTASYLSDALRSLIEAVALVVEGVPEARCSWDDEPGETRWILRREGDNLEINIIAFVDRSRGRSDDGGHEVFRATQKTLRVARVILATAQALVDDLGADEYQRQWVQHSFPHESLERLRNSIRAKRPSG